MGFMSRQPTSNDPPRKQSENNPWIEETDLMDTFALLLNGAAYRCTACHRPIRVRHLENGLCPDCRK